MNDLGRFYAYLDRHDLGLLISRKTKTSSARESATWTAFLTKDGLSNRILGKGESPDEAVRNLIHLFGKEEGPITVSKCEFKREELPRFEVAANG